MGPFDFHPPSWLRHRHAQTIAGRLLRSRATWDCERRRLPTPDGDFLLLDVSRPGRVPEDAPWCLVLHGLEGSSRSGYVIRTARHLERLGIRPVAMNFRSCGGEMNRLLRSYHSGDTGDLRWVARRMSRACPAPGGAIGFSLGGNALLCALGDDGREAPFSAGVAVSVPFDLAAGASCLERGMGRFYAARFLSSLRRKIACKAARFPEASERARAALASRTIREIDEAWTAPIHGFRGADDYYARCSSLSRLDSVRVPTLLLHSFDDPFVPESVARRAAAVRNPVIDGGFTRRGGHVGFVGRGLRPRVEEYAVEWMAARLRARSPLHGGSLRVY